MPPPQHSTSNPLEQETLALLRKLVQTESVNPPGNEAAVARLLADWFRERGVEAELLDLGEGRSNLVARVPGIHPQPALALCGHLDTVPVGTGGWMYPPLGAEVVDGRVIGRGASDMKGGVAAMAAALVALRGRADPPPCDVLFLGTAGEEVGCTGARALVEGGALRHVGAMVIGEPTEMVVASAHKGALWLQVSVAGRSAHGSMPHLGSNAIANTWKFLEALMAHRFPVEDHPLLGGMTVSPNLIEGGVSVNVVPEQCRLCVDIRTVPGVSHASVLREARALLHKSLSSEDAAASQIEVLVDLAPVDTHPTTAIVRIAKEVGGRLKGRDDPLKGVPYCTDASVIVPSTGIPTILWGPGDAAQAHQPNESISLDAVFLAGRFYEEVAVQYGYMATA